jgi:TRAP-type transport system small permease protein
VSRALKALDRLLFGTIGLLLAAMLADVAVQVFFRYVIEAPPTWTEEVARFLFAWQIFLAAGLAFGRGAHIVVDVLLVALPKPGQRLLSILSNSLVLGFLGVLVWQGINMVRLTSNTVSTALNLNMGVVYAALPAGAGISAVYVLLHLVESIRGAAPPPRTPLTIVD